VTEKEYRYTWKWRLASSPAALWPFAADTNRFNRDAGVPPLDAGAASGDGGTRRLGFRRFGIALEWEEKPFEWVRPHRFGVVRRYLRGPVAEMQAVAELQPDGEGTLLRYTVTARPRNALGRVAIPVQIGRLSRRRFEETFRRYDRLALGTPAPLARRAPPRLAPGAAARLVAAREELLARRFDGGLVGSLVELVETGDELAAARVRPYVLAAEWGAEPRAVLELCLHAVRAGLLELRWDLLCPLCRGAQERAPTLGAVDPNVHCDSCLIDFRVDFDRSVELTFRPNPAVREVEEREFCVGGPGVTPHIAVQQLLAPGEERVVRPSLEPGRYRLRARGGEAGTALTVAAGGPDEGEVRVGDRGWDPLELRLGEEPSLRLVNSSEREQVVALERTAWIDDAATAAEVTALQVFRDLFASEALRPGEPISVGTVAILFTDLRDSTRFYREVGDAPAFGAVMEHLDVLRRAVADEDGAVVKAMGDAIMAVFRRPVGALRAAVRAQREVASPAASTPHWLKVGVHVGPAIAVNQEGRLDYFGSTVNLAARLVALSSGKDVVASAAVLADPEVADLLAGASVTADPLEATLKGFDDERFDLFRLSAVDPTAVREGDAAPAAR
jgi:class 3 adenylate cyclase